MKNMSPLALFSILSIFILPHSVATFAGENRTKICKKISNQEAKSKAFSAADKKMRTLAREAQDGTAKK